MEREKEKQFRKGSKEGSGYHTEIRVQIGLAYYKY